MTGKKKGIVKKFVAAALAVATGYHTYEGVVNGQKDSLLTVLVTASGATALLASDHHPTRKGGGGGQFQLHFRIGAEPSRPRPKKRRRKK